MKNSDKLKVKLDFGDDAISVGTLVQQKAQVFFKFDDDFLHRNIAISPIKLALKSDIQLAPQKPFGGLHGVFADSLPDAWGRLLLDRYLKSQSTKFFELTPLQRLAYVGHKGQGALVYEPELISKSDVELESLDFYAEMSARLLDGEDEKLVKNFYNLAGTSGGARPKIHVQYNAASNTLRPIGNNAQNGFEDWMIKFPSKYDLPDIAHIEYAYYQMAIDCGIEMEQSQLFLGEKSDCFFGTKRFDRIGTSRLHMHSVAGLLHDDFSTSSLDYGHVMDLAFRLEKSVKVYEKIIRLAAFNVFGLNQDDHSKNISFLMDKQGAWKLAPFYDLTFSPSAYNYHSLSIANVSVDVGSKDIIRLGEHFKVANTHLIIDEVKDVLNKWKKYAQHSDVSNSSMNSIDSAIQSKIKQ